MENSVITVRKVPRELKERLRVQAAQAGRSLEAHVRALLLAAAPARPDADATLGDAFRRRFGRKHGLTAKEQGLLTPDRAGADRPISFGDEP
jgi:plasmid stability protein